MSSSVRVVDHGWDRIRKELRALKGASTTVGFHKDLGKHDKGAKSVKDAPDVVTVAAWMELGFTTRAGRFIRRAFMTQAAENYAKDLTDLKAKLLDQIYAGKMAPRRALAMLGQRHEDQVKRTITTGDFAPLAQSTIDAKGSSRPLIDTGQMRQSVRHVENMR